LFLIKMFLLLSLPHSLLWLNWCHHPVELVPIQVSRTSA